MKDIAEDLDRDSGNLKSFLVETKELVDRENAEDQGFIDRCYGRWRVGFDLLKIFIYMSTEYGSEYNSRNRPHAAASSDYLFEAIVNIHAKSLRISNEIYALLREGFPDGALSRWRTLHELAVCALFIKANGKEVAKRFILHRDVDAYKKALRYKAHQSALSLKEIDDQTLAAMEARRNEIIQLHGLAMQKDLGWAAVVFGRDRVTFADLEKSVGLDKWRPYYSWSCDDIHACFTPNRVGLGVSETRTDMLLVGRSNSGFTDPAQLLAVSLNIINNCLPDEGNTEKDDVILGCLDAIVVDIQKEFWRIQSNPPA